MPFKRKGSRFWQCRRRTLAGYGDTGQLSSGVTDKRLAARMEATLEQIAERALVEPRWLRLLDAVCKDKTITLPQLMQAKVQRRLPALLVALSDPMLAAAIEAYQAGRDSIDRGTRAGFDKILEYAPDGARLSWLSDSKQIMEVLCWHEAQGVKRNSVRRQTYRAISKLLRHELGSAERNRLFQDVDFPAEDDSRDVCLTQKEVARLLTACKAQHHELFVVVLAALLTGADRGTLVRGKRAGGFARGLLCRDVQIFQEADGPYGLTYSGEIFLPDTKNTSRPRTVPFGDRLARELLMLVKGKGADEAVFSLSYSDLDFPWSEARKASGLKHLRFKDLRAQATIYAERAGIPLTVTAATVGHSDMSTTRRYQRHSAVMSTEQVRALETEMLGKTGS